MENQVVRRRASIITAHLTSHEDISATATHVFPISCSNTPYSFLRRCDNRMSFARQGSISQGYYMRQASTEQGNYIQPSKSTSCEDKAPSFSRPAQDEAVIPRAKAFHSVVQGCSYAADPAPEAPAFARPIRENGSALVHSEEKTHNPEPKSVKWSPRMDVVETGFTYVVTLEIPGVSVDNVKVEVHDHSLIINGSRSHLCCGATSSNNSAMSYHRREILSGPYQIVWPLPSNANKKNVSAEIQDGILRVTIPKLTGLRWLRKAYM